jgi:unsaturated rhamnogalacturonyl hydrolase
MKTLVTRPTNLAGMARCAVPTCIRLPHCTLLLLIAMAAFGCAGVDSRQQSHSHFDSWPAATSPQEVGKRLAERFIVTPHPNFGRTNPPNSITYPETCTWYGALTFAQLTGDKQLTSKLVARFEPLFGEEKKLIPRPAHVDATVFGSVPLELYLQTKETRYRDLGLSFADKQWETPTGEAFEKLKPEVKEWVQRGLTWHTRFWIDDMFMITMVQSQAYRATGDVKYIDRAALEMVAYLDQLQQPNGLFYHAPDVPFFWGRGDGWMAAGMSELLRSLPENHPHRPRILEGYRKMMAALLKHQGANGMWHQLIDDPESWPETSCTGMFTFAFITGVKHGWLDEATYGPAARKGWLALIKYIDANGDIHEVCEGTNKRNSRQYYLDRKHNIGDMHGQAPVLWCASALLR